MSSRQTGKNFKVASRVVKLSDLRKIDVRAADTGYLLGRISDVIMDDEFKIKYIIVGTMRPTKIHIKKIKEISNVILINS